MECPSVDQNPVARLMPFALDNAVSQFELEKWSSASKCSSSSRIDYPYSSWPDFYEAKDRPKRDASIIASLHKHLLKSHQANASELLIKIQSQAESIPYKELDTLITSLLEKMVYIVDQCPLDARQFYTSLITTYGIRFIEQEPKKPSDWARPAEKDKIRCYSRCSNCDLLREFMLNPAEETHAFTVSKEDYGHLRLQAPYECNESWDTSQESYVMTVTKTCKGWESSHSEWEKRVSKAQKTLRQLPQESMKQCLRDDYETIMNLDVIRLHAEASTATTGDESKRSAKRVRLTV